MPFLLSSRCVCILLTLFTIVNIQVELAVHCVLLLSLECTHCCTGSEMIGTYMGGNSVVPFCLLHDCTAWVKSLSYIVRLWRTWLQDCQERTLQSSWKLFASKWFLGLYKLHDTQPNATELLWLYAFTDLEILHPYYNCNVLYVHVDSPSARLGWMVRHSWGTASNMHIVGFTLSNLVPLLHVSGYSRYRLSMARWMLSMRSTKSSQVCPTTATDIQQSKKKNG